MSNDTPLSETVPAPQEVVDSFMAKLPSGVALTAVLVSHSCSKFFYAGSLCPKSSSPPDAHTVFEIGSVTKGFTGLLLADQVKSGKVCLTDNLSKLLTDWPGRFRSPTGNVTLLELATHSSGLARLPDNVDAAYIKKYAENPYAGYTAKNLYAWLDNVQALTPGSYNYSNSGFGILGHALAVTAGKSYEDTLQERVLKPLGLDDTAITLSQNQIHRLAPGHDALGKPVQNWDFDVIAPAGALRSTIQELEHFLRLALDIDKCEASFQEMLEFATRNWGTTHSDNLTIGLGWHRLMDEGLVWHNGSTGGYSSFLGWCPEKHKGVAVIASVSKSVENDVDSLALNLLQAI